MGLSKTTVKEGFVHGLDRFLKGVDSSGEFLGGAGGADHKGGVVLLLGLFVHLHEAVADGGTLGGEGGTQFVVDH